MDKEPNQNQMTEKASLNSHVMQLATAAFLYMGAAKLPGTEKVEVNLPMAKLTIDTLDMLKTKSEGNRTDDETSLLDDVLYQLRLTYVKAESAKPAAEQAKPTEDKPKPAKPEAPPADKPAEPPTPPADKPAEEPKPPEHPKQK
ncbi:DUF1844 domain-containing protein [candidate division WOR-3 bacterium]|nr:DUF1844 domain-containing protein [candidate division WOR-3 bacterium]